MSETDWKTEKAETHWLELTSEGDETGLHWWSATVKWDGCVDLHRAHNVPFGTEGRDEDHMAFSSDMHVCDLDELIERLQKLRDRAKAHYGKDWPAY